MHFQLKVRKTQNKCKLERGENAIIYAICLRPHLLCQCPLVNKYIRLVDCSISSATWKREKREKSALVKRMNGRACEYNVLSIIDYNKPWPFSLSFHSISHSTPSPSSSFFFNIIVLLLSFQMKRDHHESWFVYLVRIAVK